MIVLPDERSQPRVRGCRQRAHERCNRWARKRGQRARVSAREGGGNQHLGASQQGLSDRSRHRPSTRKSVGREDPAHVKLTVSGLTWQVNPQHGQAAEQSRMDVTLEGQLIGRRARA